MYIEIAFFFRPGRGGEGRRGGGCLCFVFCDFVLCRYITVGTYIILHTTYICNFPCLEVDFFFGKNCIVYYNNSVPTVGNKALFSRKYLGKYMDLPT